MPDLKQYDKIKLETGETARIVEILENGVMYLAEIYRQGVRTSVEHVEYKSIISVFKEVEYPVQQAI